MADAVARIIATVICVGALLWLVSPRAGPERGAARPIAAGPGIDTKDGWKAASAGDKAIHVHGILVARGIERDRIAIASRVADCVDRALEDPRAPWSIAGTIDVCLRLRRPG